MFKSDAVNDLFHSKMFIEWFLNHSTSVFISQFAFCRKLLDFGIVQFRRWSTFIRREWLSTWDRPVWFLTCTFRPLRILIEKNNFDFSLSDRQTRCQTKKMVWIFVRSICLVWPRPLFVQLWSWTHATGMIIPTCLLLKSMFAHSKIGLTFYKWPEKSVLLVFATVCTSVCTLVCTLVSTLVCTLVSVTVSIN